MRASPRTGQAFRGRQHQPWLVLGDGGLEPVGAAVRAWVGWYARPRPRSGRRRDVPRNRAPALAGAGTGPAGPGYGCRRHSRDCWLIQSRRSCSSPIRARSSPVDAQIVEEGALVVEAGQRIDEQASRCRRAAARAASGAAPRCAEPGRAGSAPAASEPAGSADRPGAAAPAPRAARHGPPAASAARLPPSRRCPAVDASSAGSRHDQEVDSAALAGPSAGLTWPLEIGHARRRQGRGHLHLTVVGSAEQHHPGPAVLAWARRPAPLADPSR